MKNGDKEDYDLLSNFENQHINGTADRVIRVLKSLDNSLGGYKISRLDHSLQTASRAKRDGADEEMIVAALLHDIGDELAPLNHAECAAAILKPYVSEKTHWIIGKHGIFQLYYYAHHIGGNKNERDKYKGHKFYKDTILFCENWDQKSFDPNFTSLALKDFEPYLRKIFSRTPYKH